MLVRQQQQVVAEARVREENMLYSYKFAANGFAARLTQADVRRLKRHPMVADVTRSYGVRSATTYTPRFLQLPGSMWASSGGPSRAGEGVIIGVVDTGIWPEHPSFRIDNSSGPYPRPPRRWAGKCVRTRDFPASRCSRKLIGARFFSRAYEAQGGVVDVQHDYRSPRDADGHGTWCAGTAAGTGGTLVTTSSEPYPIRSFGLASGMAPKAHLAVYKVLWTNASLKGYGELADVHYAIDRAIKDGVDVLSLSLGGLGPNQHYFDDLLYLLANQAGMVVVTAAGNQGPAPNLGLWQRFGIYRTISNFSPFYLTVGASSIGRRFLTQLRLGSGRVIYASGVGSGMYATRHAPLISAADAAARDASLEGASHCIPGMLSPARALGAIVLCTRGMVNVRDKLLAVAAAGSAAMILANEEGGPTDVDTLSAAADAPIPFVHVTLAQARIIRAYIQSTTKPIASILARCHILENVAPPMVASFSSTGPTVNPRFAATPPYPTNDLLKPDVVAPGVDIWAAWTGHGNSPPSPMSVARPRRQGGVGWDAARGSGTSHTSSGNSSLSSSSSSSSSFSISGTGSRRLSRSWKQANPTNKKRPSFAILSGTSMATPHVAGIAALIVQNHPDWTPAQVMSAITTTARSSYATTAGSVARVKPRKPTARQPGYQQLPRQPRQPRGSRLYPRDGGSVPSRRIPPQPPLPGASRPVTGRPVRSLERSRRVVRAERMGEGTARPVVQGTNSGRLLLTSNTGDGSRRLTSRHRRRGVVSSSSSQSSRHSRSTSSSSSSSSGRRRTSRFSSRHKPANSSNSSDTAAAAAATAAMGIITSTDNSSLIYLPIRTARGKTATPWDMGQGHIYPPSILDPGLTFNAGIYSYINFLAGQSLSRTKRLWPKFKLRPKKAYKLNRPSIAIGRLKGSVLVRRSVTSVSKLTCTYEARIAMFPANVKVVVRPSKFTIKPGEMVTYSVNLTVLRPSPIGAFSYGSVVWVDERGHVVRSILAVQPVAIR
ncbi:hypothetical protein CLOM_g24019 [Closterium sp. NIES-68]|nr:hypothetical protein CLOM_g24019 [Closterium sp. NIES-68]